MTTPNAPEVWLRGPLPNVPPLLQPVAHALMQANEEVQALMNGFPDDKLWERPAGRTTAPVASVGFHLQHLTGVLDRLFTYARGQALSENQFDALASEGKPDPALTAGELVRRFDQQVERALAELCTVNEQTLTEARGVGRSGLPSTVVGLLVHAAEHTMRHVGQLTVTVRLIQ